MKRILLLGAAFLLSYEPFAFAQNTTNYKSQGGAAWTVGGTETIVSGGALTANSGSTTNIAGTLQIGGVTVTSTAAELNRSHDASRIVAIGAGATAATCATNGTGQLNFISAASDATITLPAATGSGCEMTFEWGTLPAQAGGNTGHTGDVIKVSGANQEFRGILFSAGDDATGDVDAWAAAGGADNDKITFTSSTKFVATKGAWVKVKDVATGNWDISGMGSSTGTEATPFATGQVP